MAAVECRRRRRIRERGGGWSGQRITLHCIASCPILEEMEWVRAGTCYSLNNKKLGHLILTCKREAVGHRCLFIKKTNKQQNASARWQHTWG